MVLRQPLDGGDPRGEPDLRRALQERLTTPDLTTARVPPLGPDDHVRGEGPEAILYLDLGCPHCAAAWKRIRELELRLVFRHFPVASKHPRAPALHAAAEAAGLQAEESFWEMCDSLLGDRGHHDDPHLWERAESFNLDLDRFNADRRSEAVAERVQRDVTDGIRAGIAGTPAAFVDGRPVARDVAAELASLP